MYFIKTNLAEQSPWFVKQGLATCSGLLQNLEVLKSGFADTNRICQEPGSRRCPLDAIIISRAQDGICHSTTSLSSPVLSSIMLLHIKLPYTKLDSFKQYCLWWLAKVPYSQDSSSCFIQRISFNTYVFFWKFWV